MKIQTYKNITDWKPGTELIPYDILDKEEVHQRGLLHRSVHLLAIDEEKRIICRRRGHTEKRYPGLLTTTLGTHVPTGEDYLSTLNQFVTVDKNVRWNGEFRVYDVYENEVCGLYVSDMFSLLDININAAYEACLIDEIIKKSNLTPHLAATITILLNLNIDIVM